MFATHVTISQQSTFSSSRKHAQRCVSSPPKSFLYGLNKTSAASRLDDELLAGLVAQGLGKVLRLLDLGSRVVLRVVLQNKPNTG